MSKKAISNKENRSTGSNISRDADSSLREEYETQQALYEAQPVMVKRFFEAQAGKLAEATRRNQVQTSFSLPDRVVVDAVQHSKTSPVPTGFREQLIGGVINRLTRSDFRTLLRQRLAELEGAAEPSVAVSARLLRHAIALHMVNAMLSSGRSVVYKTVEGEEIPTLPVDDGSQLESAITQASDAIAEDGSGEANRGELQVPFVPAARRFYLPQWVAFDGEGHLLVNSVSEAEAHLASMQAYVAVLHSAASLAPYIIADSVYQQKRNGMLGQLINQGRALAYYETEEMIHIIKQRAAASDLNRGLSLSVPYFDDQELEMLTNDFEVIPAGRIMFVPAFVVRASREEQAKVAQDTRLSPSTRKYLLIELKALEKAFEHHAASKS